MDKLFVFDVRCEKYGRYPDNYSFYNYDQEPFMRTTEIERINTGKPYRHRYSFSTEMARNEFSNTYINNKRIRDGQ